MFGQRRSRIVAAILILGLPRLGHCASVVVSPTCGSRDTHFHVTVSGYPTPTICDSCFTFYTVFLNGTDVFDTTVVNGCLPNFTLDLRQRLDRLCPAVCPIRDGTNTLTVYGGADCRPPVSSVEQTCRAATFEVVPSVSDPWANALSVVTSATGLDSAVIRFDPTGSCGLPDCGGIYLAQSVRVLSFIDAESTCVPLASQNLGWGPGEFNKVAATLTSEPACTRIDAYPEERDPFMNGLDYGFDRGTPGRSGSNPVASVTGDAPNFAVPAGADSILLEYEVAAYCQSGKNKGCYLGKAFWIYRRIAGASKGTITRDPRRGPDLGQPTREFTDADSLFRKARNFSFAKSSPPSQGGMPCPGQ